MRKPSPSIRQSVHSIGLSLAIASVTGLLMSAVLPLSTNNIWGSVATAQTHETQAAAADWLLAEGWNQYDSNQQQEAIQSFQAALEIYQALSNRAGEGEALNNIGFIYAILGQYQEAIRYFQEYFEISRELGDRVTEGKALENIGFIFFRRGQYQEALSYFQEALDIRQEIGDRQGEGLSLNRIGNVYSSLGQYQEALNYYRQYFDISQEIGYLRGKGEALNNIGFVYHNLGQYQEALNYYQQYLDISQEIDYRFGEGDALNNIGWANLSLGKYQEALSYYQRSFAIRQEIGDRRGEGESLNNIGTVYHQQENYADALQQFQQALTIRRTIGDRTGEAQSLWWIGYQLQQQSQSELAIVFYKDAINVQEAIRTDLGGLPQELQESYTRTKAEENYRRLADLLLQQDRILEAQQVLDLLKVQELDDYLRGVRGVNERVSILRPEQEILTAYDELQKTAIDIGQELTELRQRRARGDMLSTSDEQRLETLKDLQEDINRQFTAFLYSAEVEQHLAELSPRLLRQNIDLADLAGLQDNLANLNAVLLYPLILGDRLELVITTPVSPPLRRTVDIEKADLNRIISDLRQQLRDPSSDPKALAQELYSYLIRPIEQDLADLTEASPTGTPPTIIYAPDGALRYIPLSTLHDGNDWLAQRFRINNITAKSFTEFQSEPVTNPQVLAAAFADETLVHPVPVGNTTEEFRGLPFAGTEVINLTNSFTSITAPLLDRDFNWDALKDHLDVANIVHFATHAAAVPEAPELSFILFGDGTAQTLLDIPNWPLENVDLVVLSACETGIPGQLTSGDEILGLGYQFQTRGARAVIASLWKVSDGGTQALMTAFYTALQQPGITKAEALRQAQTALITGDYQVLGLDERGATGIRQRIQTDIPQPVSSNLDYPYYWSPFILIGNGL